MNDDRIREILSEARARYKQLPFRVKIMRNIKSAQSRIIEDALHLILHTSAAIIMRALRHNQRCYAATASSDQSLAQNTLEPQRRENHERSAQQLRDIAANEAELMQRLSSWAGLGR